jgi:hypothetical protein
MKLAVGAISSVLLAAAAWANWNDTATGIDLKSLPAFPLTKVRSGLLRTKVPVRVDGLTARMVGRDNGPVPGGAILEGTAKSGKRWAAHFGWLAFDEVYRGDLDGNGTQDYVMIGATGFMLRTTPPRSLIVLLMDKQGLPTPFETGLYDVQGISHVVDVLHNGRAQLAVSDYDENPWDNRSGYGCSGHWVTDLYEAKDLNWSEFRGSAAGLTFPFVFGWTEGPECDPPDRPSQPWKPDVRTNQHSTAIADIFSARITESNSGWVKLTPPSGCEDILVGAAVYDQRSQREISLFSLEYGPELLSRIQSDRADVTLRGVYRPPDGRSCTANLLWASK